MVESNLGRGGWWDLEKVSVCVCMCACVVCGKENVNLILKIERRSRLHSEGARMIAALSNRVNFVHWGTRVGGAISPGKEPFTMRDCESCDQSERASQGMFQHSRRQRSYLLRLRGFLECEPEEESITVDGN